MEKENTLTIDKVLTKDDYFQIIIEIRDLERISLDNYLEDKFQKVFPKNPDFVKIIYKDIFNVLDGVDDESDNDLVIENGDFVVEYGDIKLSGHPTNLHYAMMWLYMKLVEEFITDNNPLNFSRKMELFEKDFLNINYDAPSYSKTIADLNLQLRKERNTHGKSRWTWNDLNEIIILKPQFAGMGIDLNAIFSKILNPKKRYRITKKWKKLE